MEQAVFACFYSLSAKWLYVATNTVIFIAKTGPLQVQHTRRCRQQGVVGSHLARHVFPKEIPKAQSCFGEFSFPVIPEPRAAAVPQGARWGEVPCCRMESMWVRVPGEQESWRGEQAAGRDQTCFPSRGRAEHPPRAASDSARPK